MQKRLSFAVAAFLTVFILTSCNDGSTPVLRSSIASQPTGPSDTPSDTQLPSQREYSTDALLFVGSGTWSPEVASIQNILASNGASYQRVSSAQLDSMSVDEMAKYGVLIFPGGSGGTEAGSLSAGTHARLREAVQVRGVSYIGFCAGAFIAQAPAPASGRDVSYGLGVVPGPELQYYFLENQGTDIAMTKYSFPDGSTRDILFYGGPVTPNLKGGVIAKYPNGDPSITQVWSGKGFVIMSGGHPTATQGMLSSLGMSSSDGTHTDFAWTLIHSAMTQSPLLAF